MTTTDHMRGERSDGGHDDDGYRGPASLQLADGQVLEVGVTLRGYVEPLDGRYHWYGRVAVHAELEAALGGKRARAVVSTPQGEAVGELSDVDPWGRYRIAGTSTPPFAVETDVADGDGAQRSSTIEEVPA